MRKFIIAGHGQFASGLKSALDIIAGEIDRVWVIDAYVDENKSIESEIKEVVSQLNVNDELIVLTDLMGGSITNQVIRSVDLNSVYVVAGVNFPVLIDLVMSDPDTPTAEAIESALTIGREQLVHVNRLIDNQNTHD